MANIELKFIDSIDYNDFIKVEVSSQIIDEQCLSKDCVYISGIENGNEFQIILDKSTAIKFAKTLRTEINKIVE